MATVKITCDSACDLPQSLSGRYRIEQLPLKVQLGNEIRRDRVDVEPGELFRYSSQTGELPGIQAVPPQEYRRCFESYVRQGCQVVHISISSRLSRCYENACQAAFGLPGVCVVDSQSVSAGAGHLAMLASELASADYLAKDILKALDEMKEHLDVSFVVQSPEYLHHSGKRGGLRALGDKILHLKPEIILENGRIHRGRPFHGSLESSVLSYVRRQLSAKSIQSDRIFITYSGISQSLLDQVTSLLRQLHPFEQILAIPASSAVSCRCGPASLGLAFMTA